MELVPVGTDIIAFRAKQLPMRGTCTESLINRALVEIAEGVEFLIVRASPAAPEDPRLWGEMGDTHGDLRETLQDEDVFGREVALGACPPFIDADNQDMVSASKGGIDGPR